MKTLEFNDSRFGYPVIVKTPTQMKDNLPLIVQLHGAGERGDGSEDQLRRVEWHGFSEIITEETEYDCVIAMPQCPENSFWVAEIPFIKEFIMKIVKEFHCDPDRISLTGLSMGGYGTWYTAMAYPEMFAAIAPCCGGGMPWNAGVLKMPVWAFHGGIDDVVFPYETENMIRGMEAAGLHPKLTIHPESGHDVWDLAYREELLEWLMEQKKNCGK